MDGIQFEDLNNVIFGDMSEQLEESAKKLQKVSEAQYAQELQKRIDNEKTLTKTKKQLQAELDKINYKNQIEDARKKIDETASYEQKQKLKQQAEATERELNLQKEIDRIYEERQKKEKSEKEKQLEKEKRHLENQRKMADDTAKFIGDTVTKLQRDMTIAATTYSGYVDKISTRLLGANETFSSISKTISGAFGASPFFKMSTVFDSVSKAVQQGISFNIEQRAAMEVISEKVAATFDAFNGNLVRLIKVQQEDSTQARLGMESFLNQFLNSKYQDTSYLNNLSKTVSENLFQASAIRGMKESTELEYVVQKYLGSLSSVGVSDSLVTQLSQGIGYMASGDISSLNSNTQLEQLLAVIASKGGGSFGDMILGNFGTDQVSYLFNGLYNLVTEIKQAGVSGNIVALNEYARTFGMTVSDITSVLNIEQDQLKQISNDLKSFDELEQRVVDETSFSKLFSRTGGASIGDTLYQNFIQGAGKQIGSNPAAFLAWQVADLVAGALSGVQTGIKATPFGVGTTVDLDMEKILRAATVVTGSLAGVGSMLSGLGSLSGVNISKLDKETLTTARSGSLLSMATQGTNETFRGYVGDFSDTAMSNIATDTSNSASESYVDDSYSEEKENMKATQTMFKDLLDETRFISHLLDSTGIVIRNFPNSSFAAGQSETRGQYFDELTSGELSGSSNPVSLLVGG